MCIFKLRAWEFSGPSGPAEVFANSEVRALLFTTLLGCAANELDAEQCDRAEDDAAFALLAIIITAIQVTICCITITIAIIFFRAPFKSGVGVHPWRLLAPRFPMDKGNPSLFLTWDGGKPFSPRPGEPQFTHTHAHQNRAP